MSAGGFFYECEVCKGKIPATFEEPMPEGVEAVVKAVGPVKTETTFRHTPECPPPTTDCSPV